jgi:HEAT repeat protein
MNRAMLLLLAVLHGLIPGAASSDAADSDLALALRLLESKNTSTKLFALDELQALGPKAKEAAPRIRELLKDADATVRLRAAVALWKVAEDEAAITALTAVLAERDEKLRQQATEALSAIGARAVPALGQALEHRGDERVRLAAVRMLGTVEPRTKAVSQALRRAMLDSDLAVADVAAAAVAREPSNSTLELLVLAQHREAEVRRLAVYALLQRTDVDGKEFRNAAAQLLSSSAATSRKSARGQLEGHLRRSRQAVSEWLGLLAPIRIAVEDIVGESIEAASPQQLRDVLAWTGDLQQWEAAARRRAARCLAETPKLTPAVLDGLLLGAEDKDALVALQCRAGLKALDADGLERMQIYVQAGRDMPRSAMGERAAQLLGELEAPASVTGLLLLANAKDEAARLKALIVLMRLGERAKGAAPTLAAMLHREGQSPFDRRFTARTLWEVARDTRALDAYAAMLLDVGMPFGFREWAAMDLTLFGREAEYVLPALVEQATRVGDPQREQLAVPVRRALQAIDPALAERLGIAGRQ